MNNLTCDGYRINNDDFVETIETAEKACETSKLIRLARTAGRREADKVIQGKEDRLVLAIHIMDTLIAIVHGKEFTENEITDIERAIRFVKDPESGYGVGSGSDICADSGSTDSNGKRLSGSPDGLGESEHG